MANYAGGRQQGNPGDPANKYIEKVVAVNRVTKVVKGGKRMSFNAIVVVGDGKGNVGCSLGKANEVQKAIQKAVNRAKKEFMFVPIVGTSIPHEIIGISNATKVLLKPALPGTGIVAGNSVRSVVESCGIKDILSKCHGSRNAINVVYATMDGLRRLRTREQIMQMRGKNAS